MQKIHETFQGPDLPTGFSWFNEPQQCVVDNGLQIVTKAKSDFWQRTHCGARRDNGHSLLTKLEGGFTVTTEVESEFQALYDQCGLMIRVDDENWIKTSAERESQTMNRLGSVVTNLGYSDWSTQDIPGERQHLWFRISRLHDDFLIESSFDGNAWHQLRVAHLHRCPELLEIGVYACSPKGEGFSCRFRQLIVEECRWDAEG